ncbi:MAG TPA: serine/threonine-protein kinase, partial [Polyangiaceae bacterium LLY-WYZ-15_(1-7)]|nr:serine/threonine-protein kinase [Polyangiaceae bacterium LLY-WYZ-15_(1-7)]
RAQQMGAYHMIELLGRGGMGEVWRATHRMLARPAAIKLIRPEALSGRASATQRQTLKARFEREARATAQLSSPHTISIYDFGATEDGVLYYVMELLDGTDLETLVAEHGPLPAGRVVHLLKQACESLAEAHRAGLVHRDVKPANLYVCRLGTKVDEVKVLDFGLVALQSGGRLTGDDQITGTPAYLAPEVVRGDREPDERVDVYALGCVAYWLLTGELVFPGKTPFEVLYGHVEEAPTPPSERARQPIPAALEALVLECLEKDPEARPRDAEDLGARLGAVVVEEPWTEAEALAWWQRHGPKPPEKIVEAPAHVRTAFPAREP